MEVERMQRVLVVVLYLLSVSTCRARVITVADDGLNFGLLTSIRRKRSKRLLLKFVKICNL